MLLIVRRPDNPKEVLVIEAVHYPTPKAGWFRM